MIFYSTCCKGYEFIEKVALKVIKQNLLVKINKNDQ